MKTIFKRSAFDNNNKYGQEIENEEQVILVRSLVLKINKKILKKGAKYKCVEPNPLYVRFK